MLPPRKISCRPHPGPLFQACAAKTFQIASKVGVIFDRHVAGDPGKRDVGLRAAELSQSGGGNFDLPGQTLLWQTRCRESR
jgi:hypothetical protein